MKEKIVRTPIALITILVLFTCSINAQTNTPMRRPVSPEQPMWLIHIDTWNYADPQKIIDLIPKDIRPFVVMNISLSVSNDGATGKFTLAEYGYEIAKSWLRTCAENRMWAMVQPSSGAYSQLPDNDMTIYEELYNDYPNLIGFNYCEQSWGYGDNNPLATRWENRIAHFAKLLKLNDKYGGYLVVSWCGNQWSSNINPIAMQKRNPEFAAACTNYTKNYILCEKYTFKTYQSDMESVCLGSYLSGYSGQYGIRYDDSGWTDKDGNINENFTMATYGAPFLEHVMLTGQTVIDAPELIWTHCFKEVDAGPTTNGYTMRKWETFPEFDNVSVDLFRKVLDGTVRIPSRQEVIDRTKVVIINDVNSGTNDNKYSSPETLFEGLYRMDGDGNYGENKSFFKKSGRYPTIPTVYKLNDEIANSFQVKVNKSGYSNRWPSISSKVTEFNNRFPEEYTGDLYAGRYENGWVTYNPYKTGQNASAIIPFKYNTCDRMELSYSQYTAGVIKEYPDRLIIYLSNFDNQVNANQKTNTIKIYGSTSEPTYSFVDRGENILSKVTKDWSNGLFTLTIEHNGPVDITLNCSGSATDRLTEYQAANVVVPNCAPAYSGPRQYEGETFEYKNITGIVKSGYNQAIRNYTGQGYLQFGTNSAASVRDNVSVLNDGTYILKTKYSVTGGDINTIDLYVNGTKVATPVFPRTASLGEWAVNSQMVDLNMGTNTIEFRAKATGTHSIYFDNMVIESGNSNDVWMEGECGNMGLLWETISNSDASNGNFVTIQSDNNNTVSAPDNLNGHINFEFNSSESGTYTAWARVITPSAEDDVFWVKMDSESWLSWGDILPSTSWTWVKINTFTLAAGEHTLTVAHNEDGTQLDKLFITMSDDIPSEKGGPATNCTTKNQSPFAFAGFNKTIINSDGSGMESVTLDGMGSVDADGSIVSYVWSSGIVQLADEKKPTINLPVGVHTISLTVTDNEGATDTDVITITIYETTFEENRIWVESECAIVGNNWRKVTDENASGGQYVTAKSGFQSTSQAPATDDGLIKISFNIASAGNYSVYGRMNCPNYEDDSFWLKIDNGSYKSYNGLKSNAWEWKKFDSFNLSKGEHAVTIGYREDGAQLDKLFISKYSEEPTGMGNEAINACNDVSVGVGLIINHSASKLGQNYPNPVKTSTLIKYSLERPGHVMLKIYDLNGQEIETLVNKYQSEGDHEIEFHAKGLTNGLYFYNLQVGDYFETKKIIIQK